MKNRVISGIVIAVCAVLLLFVSIYVIREVYDLVIVFFMIMCVNEISQAIGKKYKTPNVIYLYISVIVSYLAYKGVNDMARHLIGKDVGGNTAFLTAIFFLVVFNIIFNMFSADKELEVGVTTLACLFYPVVFLCFMIAVNYLPGSKTGLAFSGWVYDAYASGSFVPNLRTNAIILAFACSSGADMFALFFGKLFKGPKFCPKISPSKTWAGAFGGLFGGVFAAFVVCIVGWFTPLFGLTPISGDFFINLILFTAIGIIIAVADEFGDLLASYVKRLCGIKDYGNLIPGHGGVLDRIDGLIISSMVTYFIMYIISQIYGLM